MLTEILRAVLVIGPAIFLVWTGGVLAALSGVEEAPKGAFLGLVISNISRTILVFCVCVAVLAFFQEFAGVRLAYAFAR